jgi:titin
MNINIVSLYLQTAPGRLPAHLVQLGTFYDSVDSSGKIRITGNATTRADVKRFNSSSAIVEFGRPPVPPLLTYVSGVGPNRARVSWANVNDASPNDTLYQPEVFRNSNISSPTWISIGTVGGGQTELTDTNLVPGTMYQYQVRFTNADGIVSSEPFAITTPSAPLGNPAAATGLVANSVTSTSCVLKWVKPSTRENFIDIRRFDGGSWSSRAILPAGATTFSDTGLQAGTSYSYKIHTVYDYALPYPLGFGVTSSVSIITPLSINPPANPSGLSAATINKYYIRLTWSDNSDNEDDFELRRRVSTDSGQSYGPWGSSGVISPVDSQQCFDYDVSTGHVIQYKIHARNSAGISWSNEISVTVP